MKRIYYGWWLVAIALLTNMIFNGVTYSAFSLFVLPVSAEFHLSRAEMNTAMVCLSLGQAALAPFLGRLIDFVPARRAMVVSALVLGASLATLGLSHSPLLSAVVFAVPIPAALVGSPFITLPLLVNRWFTARRGRAMALSVIGTSLGFVLVAPLIGLMIQRFGWRDCLLILAGASTVLLIALALMVRERPGPGELEPGEAAGAVLAHGPAAGAPAPLGAILGQAQFWTLMLGVGLASAMATTLMISFVPLAVRAGLSIFQATSLVSAIGLGALGAKLGLALIADRFDRVLLMAAIVALGAGVNAALLLAASYPVLVLCAIVLGLSVGVVGPLTWAVIADRFGAASFGTVSGLMSPFIAGMSALGQRFAGEAFDRTGGYSIVFATFTASELAAAALIVAMRFTAKAPILLAD